MSHHIPAGRACYSGVLRNHPLLKAYLALLAVCFFWGTTYIAIRMSLEAIPPVVLVSARFILSGALMLAGVLAARARLPRGRELWATALNGVLILGVGNTCLSVAELWIPSGLAALIITTSPFWMVGLDALVPGGSRLRLPTIAGILVGLTKKTKLLEKAKRSRSMEVRINGSSQLCRPKVVDNFANTKAFLKKEIERLNGRKLNPNSKSAQKLDEIAARHVVLELKPLKK
jgi:hypothetical protein